MFGISAQQAAVGIGADATLISRWRNGQRKLVAGRRWVKSIVDYAITLDSANKPKLLPKMMVAFFPMDDFSDPDELGALFERWLCAKTQFSDAYASRRALILHEIFAPPKVNNGEGLSAKERRRESVKGNKAIRKGILALEDYVTAMEPSIIQFVCPAGLSIITDDPAYSKMLMDMLMRLFALGHRMQVVIRTDFKVSDVSHFAGRWLFAHLLGYIKSFYYDDFRKVEDAQMIAVVSDKVAMKITLDEVDDVKATFMFDSESVGEIREKTDNYFALAVQRFRYSFFTKPDDFLKRSSINEKGVSYLYSRLPHLGIVGDEFLDMIGLADEEKDIIREQFFPFLHGVEELSKDAHVYHLFCVDDIESALEKPRHLIPEFSAMLGHRVYIKTQGFVDLLIKIKAFTELPNYHLCFLREEHFERINMNLAVWGSDIAIGWIPGGLSTVCKDFSNVGNLNGFAGTVWDMIPGPMKTVGAARKRLAAWLKRASLFGYDISKT